MKVTNPVFVLGVIGVGILCLLSYDAGKRSRSDHETSQRTMPAATPASGAADVATNAAKPPPKDNPHPQQPIQPAEPSAELVSTAEAPALTALQSAPAAQKHSTCKSVSQMAARIMSNRHQGVAMSAMLEVADGAEEASGVARALVMAAYEEPRYSTPEMQEKSAQDFENTTFLECIKASQPN